MTLLSDSAFVTLFPKLKFWLIIVRKNGASRRETVEDVSAVQGDDTARQSPVVASVPVPRAVAPPVSAVPCVGVRGPAQGPEMSQVRGPVPSTASSGPRGQGSRHGRPQLVPPTLPGRESCHSSGRGGLHLHHFRLPHALQGLRDRGDVGLVAGHGPCGRSDRLPCSPTGYYRHQLHSMGGKLIEDFTEVRSLYLYPGGTHQVFVVNLPGV